GPPGPLGAAGRSADPAEGRLRTRRDRAAAAPHREHPARRTGLLRPGRRGAHPARLADGRRPRRLPEHPDSAGRRPAAQLHHGPGPRRQEARIVHPRRPDPGSDGPRSSRLRGPEALMTADAATLNRILTSIEGRGYGAYKQLRGTYDLGSCRLVVDHVQVDPFAPPSLMRLVVGHSAAAIPEDLLAAPRGRVAATDFLARTVAAAAASTGEKISIGTPGPEILERTSHPAPRAGTAAAVTGAGIEARIAVQLPAPGRRIRGRQAARLLTEDLPRIAESTLFHASLDAAALRDHVTLYRDQEALRDQLEGRALVAFVGDGA